MFCALALWFVVTLNSMSLAGLMTLAAALLIIWQVTKRRRLAAGVGTRSGAGQLIVTRGQASPSALRLDKPVITIGRDPGSDLVIMDDLASFYREQFPDEEDGGSMPDEENEER